MSTVTPPELEFTSTFADEVPELSQAWQAAAVPEPQLIAFNAALCEELGLDTVSLTSPAGVGMLAGNVVPDSASPVAMAYAGHQFGGFAPRLGDGRALLLGEVVDRDGHRRDLHLKGSGRTPFARGGDGKAAVGPMLREYLVAESMHALGVPTTRALAVVSTGEQVMRDRGPEPGAILTRVAASHLRVGTFEYAARLPDPTVLQRLADHAIARHHSEAAEADQPYLALLEAVVEVQARLIADWMLLGFIHGVMNTDNMTISGEGIDYGPCAFMDRYDPATVFSSIDHAGRYAFANQPGIGQWNLSRFAETLLALIDPSDVDAAIAAATEVLETFTGRTREHWLAGMATKLGLDGDAEAGDAALVESFLELLAERRADYTTSCRDLGRLVRGDDRAQGGVDLRATSWFEPWWDRLRLDQRDPQSVAAQMDEVNPIYIPRNHLVEEALAAATTGDLVPFEQLLAVCTDPFAEREGLDQFTRPAPDGFADGYRTFCGT